MEKSKTGKYFKYAFGEIILVVIGILIALSINTWNENRKNVNQIKDLLLSLEEEVKISENYLRKRSERKIETIKILQSTIEALNSETKNQNVDSLINNLIKAGAFYERPLNRTAIDNFNKSNLINDLKDTDLKDFILYHETYIRIYGETNKTLSDYVFSYISPYFFKNSNLANNEIIIGEMNFNTQAFSHDQEAFVKNRELTNIIYEYVGWMNYQNSIFLSGQDYFKKYHNEIQHFLEKK
jgi:hypothetical protein